MTLAIKNEACRYCKSTDLTLILDLGSHPPSNSFLAPGEISSESKYPLEVYFCGRCFLVQLLHVVPAEQIFDDYLYLSSSSRALQNHYAALARSLSETFGLGNNDLVVDIGCNDGILLHGYALSGLRKVGVEPSRVAAIAEASGLQVLKAFFSSDSAAQIVAEHGKAKVVTATNVFAHVDDISGFVDGVSVLLADDGVFVVEVSYLIDVVDQILFDTIYHEHLCYLALTPMVKFLEQFGLVAFRAERIPFGASGPALRVYVSKDTRSNDSSVNQLIKLESDWGVGHIERYLGYAARVQALKTAFLDLLSEVAANASTIGGYGAPAKGNTLLNYFGLTNSEIKAIAETNEMKQGLVTPGSHIPIISEEEFLALMPPFAVLLTWNYLDFFLEKSPYIAKGGRFITPLPVPAIVP